MTSRPEPSRGWGRRIAWLLALWSASVLILGAAAYLLRLLMGVVGMTA